MLVPVSQAKLGIGERGGARADEEHITKGEC